MAKNKIIWGFDSPTFASAVRKFIVSDDMWFADRRLSPECSFDMISLFDGSFVEPAVEAVYTAQGYELYANNVCKYMDMFSRTAFGRVATVTEANNYLLRVFNNFFSAIDKSRYEGAVFISPPHFGVDEIVKDICVYKGIPVVILYQTIFSDRFLVLDDQLQPLAVPDFMTNTAALDIPEPDQPLFYMKNVKRPKSNLPKLVYSAVSSLAKPGDKSYYKVKKHYGQNVYQKEWRTYEKDFLASDEHLNAPYVYFPLHLQPEMTTTALGGKYADQVLALEHLETTLPEGWSIVIKENPKQDFKQRDSAFIARLKQLKRVRVADIKTPSISLIQGAKLVATISGTAGWEAIRMNTPVISFGWGWYNEFPGIYKYDSELDMIAISNADIQRPELECAFNDFKRKCCKGVVDDAYLTISEMSEVEHLQRIENFLDNVSLYFER